MKLKRRTQLIRFVLFLAIIPVLTGCGPNPQPHWWNVGYSRPEPPEGQFVRPVSSDPVYLMPITTSQGMCQPTISRNGNIILASYAIPTGQMESSALLVEEKAPAEVQVGYPFSYEIKVSNISECELREVTLSDQCAESFMLRNASPTPTNTVTQGHRWVFNNLRPGESKTITITGIARENGSLNHQVNVSYQSQMTITTQALEPLLELVKKAPPEVLICDTWNTTLSVRNIGSGIARNVKIMDVLAPGLLTTEGARTVEFEVGDLGRGETREFNVSLLATQPGTYINTATAKADGSQLVEAQTETTVREPILEIAQSQRHQKVYVGQVLTYDVMVTNQGNTPAIDTVIRSNIPAGIQYVNSEGGQLIGSDTVEWHVGTIEPGQSRQVSLSMRSDAITKVRNTVQAHAKCAKVASSTLESTLLGIPAILLEMVDSVDPIRVGENVEYRITATNQGSAVGTNIQIVCTLEPAMQFISANGATMHRDIRREDNNEVITFEPLKRLAAHENAVWNVIIRAVKPADARFRVSMTTDQLTKNRPVVETESTNFYMDE